MAGFFKEPAALPPPLGDFLEWFYPDRPPQEYNLEEVLAFLDISRARLALWAIDLPPTMRFNKGELYSILLRYVISQLSIPAEESCPIHTKLTQSLGPDDSIITLNYDVIVERSLRITEPAENARPHDADNRLTKVQALIGTVLRLMQPTPGLIERESTGGYYLKLHGSLDWLSCPTPGCVNNSNLYSTEVSGVEGQHAGAACRHCGSALQVFIIPPVATKRLEDRGRMAFLWNLALKEMASADEVVITGLSLAASDFELRWLVRQAISLRVGGSPLDVRLVNPSGPHRDQIRRFLPQGVRVISEHEDFAAYVGYVDEPVLKAAG